MVNHPSKLHGLCPNVWTMAFPLKIAGVDIRRVVTILRLSTGRLIVHSTAPFAPGDIAAIRKLGEPGWLVDALLRHDTYAGQGRRAFPEIPYLAPPGFSVEGAESLTPPPPEWAGEVEVEAIDGAPDFGEIAIFHAESRTLVVADLLVNFPGEKGMWESCVLKIGGVGGHSDPGMTRPFKHAIEDMAAFAASVRRVLEWDFERIVVGHGEPILTGAKEKLRETLKSAGVEGI